ncbi:type II secretion system F family protein [Desulfosporosinus sp. FKB]|uniref:type II secretion system F family protein n=1 Tax=Desulfosporosinus sp. FKB TaxID=1969835 RepID=UPI000B49CA09|nr:type II secretion system F family protein [Desulfosporosinus sp. FKB]
MSKRWFKWKAVDAQGILQSGRCLGNDSFEVQTLLKKEGYLPVKIKKHKNWLAEFIVRSNAQWGHFANRLSSLLEAGIPLLQALEIMTQSQGNLTFEQSQWSSVKNSIAAGCDLWEALLQLKSPPNAYVLSMIKAGEYSGNLANVLSEVAAELEQEDNFRQRIKAALAYPIFLLLAVFVVLCSLSMGVLPMYERLFASMNVELPELTQVIFAVGRKFPLTLQVMGGLAVMMLLICVIWKPKDWQNYLNNKIRHFPYLGRIFRLRDLIQFNSILGHLLMTGIPLLEGLRLTAGTLQTMEMLALTERLMLSVKQGNPMADLLFESGIFPKEGAEMIAVAEESGNLDKMFLQIALSLRKDLEFRLDQFTRILGPALILVMAGLVGLVAGGVMIPIFDLSSQLK